MSGIEEQSREIEECVVCHTQLPQSVMHDWGYWLGSKRWAFICTACREKALELDKLRPDPNDFTNREWVRGLGREELWQLQRHIYGETTYDEFESDFEFFRSHAGFEACANCGEFRLQKAMVLAVSCSREYPDLYNCITCYDSYEGRHDDGEDEEDDEEFEDPSDDEYEDDNEGEEWKQAIEPKRESSRSHGDEMTISPLYDLSPDDLPTDELPEDDEEEDEQQA